MAKKEKEVKVKKEKQKEERKDGFFKKLHKEMKEVKWPSFKEMAKYTLATILVVLGFIIFFQLLDLLISFVKGLF